MICPRPSLLPALALLALLASASGAQVFAADPILTARDGLSVPRQRVELSAKLEGTLGPLRPDQPRERLEFQLGEELVSALTDSDGVARASLTPLTSGVLNFEVRLQRDPRIQATGKLWSVAPSRPVIVSDIDGTLSSMAGWKVPFLGERAEAYPGAAELLRELAETHTLVYLSARDESFRAGSRAFLSRHAFPPGPLLLNSWGLDKPEQREQLRPGRHGEFKARVLRSLKERGLTLAFGLGDKETDAEAYEAVDLRSLIRGTDSSIGKRSIVFPDYAALRRRLVEEGILSEESR